MGLITIGLPHLTIDSDLKVPDLNENLQDYNNKITSLNNLHLTIGIYKKKPSHCASWALPGG